MVETVKVDGLRELDRALRRLDAAVGKKIMVKSLKQAAKPILAEMKAAAPVATGAAKMVKNRKGALVEHRPGFLKHKTRMRSNFNNRGAQNTRRFKGSNTVAIVKVGVFGVPYVGHVEFGTSQQAANPFIRKALYDNWRQAVVTYKSQLRENIEAAGRSR